MSQQERARRTREHILDAAASEFAVQGYQATTMILVAERIGMTKGALYGHFPSKDHLAEAIVRHTQDSWREVTRQAAASPSEEAAGRLRDALAALARLLHEDVRARAAFRLIGDWTAAGGPTVDLLDQIRDHLTGLVGQAQRTGRLTPLHPADAIVGLLLAVLFAGPLLTNGSDDPTRTKRSWLEALWTLLGGAPFAFAAGSD